MPITNPDYSNLNHDEMAKEIGLKPKHMPMLIGSFLDESAPILERLTAAIEAKDYGTIKTAAHSIKGSAGNLRFNELYEMSKEIEHAGAESNASFEYSSYLNAIKQAVSTIKV
jgi:HPt (histidine-containing phosphotransfer) domain-containing protein